MPIVSAHGLLKSYGPAVVLDGVSATIRRGERVGLVGSNGSGKSTLARILAGREPPDQGTVSWRAGQTIGYLAQEPALDPACTGRDYVLSGLEAWSAACRRYHELAEELAEAPSNAALLQDQTEIAQQIEALGGWELEHRADVIIHQLGIRNPEQPLGTLSGGERRRIALGRVLVARPSLAVLDEPTNHLDADTVEWLEQALKSYPGALLLITHDRYLLDRVVQRTLELAQARLYSYDGGWEDYLRAKAERTAIEARTESNRQRLVSRELEWLRRQPKARTGKQKARQQRALSAMSGVAPSLEREVQLGMTATQSGGTILELEGFRLELGGRCLVDKLDLVLVKGERVGIIGPNGSGKTSLLRCLVRELQPAGGHIIRGKNTEIAYFDQARATLEDDASVMSNVAEGRETVSFGSQTLNAYSYLERFLFHGDKVRQPVGSLSGGERARVALAKLLLGRANVLLLDEPSNDLDVSTLSALEEMLEDFSGTVLVVTHDRYFLDRVATSILVLHGDGSASRYPGNYSTYLRLRAEQRMQADAAAVDATIPKEDPPRRRTRQPGTKLTYAEQMELDGLLDRVTTAEEQVRELEGQLADPATYAGHGGSFEGVAELQRQLADARSVLERLTTRWEELESKREALAQTGV